jgi:RnfABCDGE-type electron transport complex E subunit
MTSGGLIERLRTGLWKDNPGLVQLLGLCPLLAVTTTTINGVGLGIATLLVLTCSNALVSATRRWIRQEIRIPIYVLIIASLVTCVELIFKAWFPTLDQSLGIFIPLIVTNCAIVARAEIFASRNTIGASIIDGLGMGAGFAALLIALGIFRELVGQASILGFSFAESGFRKAQRHLRETSRARSKSGYRTPLCQPIRTTCRRDSVRTGDGRQRQQGDRSFVPGCQHA